MNRKWEGHIQKIRGESLRDAAMVAMLAHYGLKPGEVLALKGEHLDLQEGTFIVDERKFDLHEGISGMLKELGAGEAAWVFEGRKGKAITARNLQLITKKWVGKTPHQIRREFAKDFVAKGGHPAELKKVLGHAKLETTARLLE